MRALKIISIIGLLVLFGRCSYSAYVVATELHAVSERAIARSCGRWRLLDAQVREAGGQPDGKDSAAVAKICEQ